MTRARTKTQPHNHTHTLARARTHTHTHTHTQQGECFFRVLHKGGLRIREAPDVNAKDIGELLMHGKVGWLVG